MRACVLRCVGVYLCECEYELLQQLVFSSKV